MKKSVMLMAAMLAMTPLIPAAACAPAYAMDTAVLSAAGTVQAGGGPASIVLKPSSASQTLQGRRFTLYRLFEAEPAAGGESVVYRFDPKTEAAVKQAVAAGLGIQAGAVGEQQAVDYVASLSGQDSALRQFLSTVQDHLQPAQGESFRVDSTAADGSFTIAGLDYGWYMADEEGTDISGSHAAASLLMVSTAAPSVQIKVKSDYPQLIKQIEEDDGTAGWNDIGDYQYGQAIPYRFETTLPDVTGYETYLMRFHDRMDPALDFDPSSVAVTLDKDGKQYRLSPQEFTITDTPTADETFSVTIPDIKAIADREFGSFGQRVELTYNGVFNEGILDRQDQGKQGFENTVRLEFSNDPDSSQTGFTPWDTVVCYTYRLNAVKHNENDVKLAGAKFRLYLDKDCQTELGFAKHGDVYLPAADAQDIVTDDEGSFRLDGLDQGTYWLREVQAPAGYHKLKDPIEITITPGFVDDRHAYVAGGQGLTDLTATAGGQDLETDPIQTSANLSVLNRTGSVLPSTGSGMTIVLFAAAAGLAVTGLWMGRRRG
ncbi:SpaA isopeptide-forming pilin-related protein [Faecalibaculum rodentium]|jgi:fimbrial isopeptide formation D2 family protein/LPXTG-motif cell wall-anchored protein|uniref:SpaA isopeptide-forming pilin-related protein n=1 Tax=Faecalibaculum rodentium TaxID=1702221 RepID=UPI0023F05067|nr:SpaA isopeptide-forming pilin-related protein [Faecalibaculum rodentium]